MSVAMICRSSSSVSFPLEKKVLLGSILMPITPLVAAKEAVMIKDVDESPPPPGEVIDIWTSIQARKAKQPNVEEPTSSYVHPLTRRSSSLMSQKGLEVCTENLGSESGSDHYSSEDMDYSTLSTRRPIKQQVILQQELDQEEENDVGTDHENETAGAKRKAAVSYHCSSRRSAPSRAFPPPLPSISCRDGPCVQMRPHRKDGRLVVEAVAVPSQNYLHAQRQGGRLLLSFIDTTTSNPNKNIIINITTNLTPPEHTQAQQQQVVDDADLMELEEEEEEEEEEEAEEEVEVVDRGTVVEVKVSTQPQQQSGGGGSAAMKVHRSSIVINKFVSCTSLSSQGKENSTNSSDVEHAIISTTSGTRRSTACSTTTAAAAAVAASSLSALPADGDQPCSFDNKLLFTSKRRNSREELLRDMRRCSQLRKPLFIWEPCCCIAT